LYLRPLTAILQLVAALLCLTAQVMLDWFMGSVHAWHYSFVLLALVGACFTYRVQSMRLLLVAGILNVQFIAMGFAVLTLLLEQRDFWFLPIGLCITLSIVALYHKPEDYALSAGLVWLSLAWVIQPSITDDVQWLFVPLVMLGSLVVGLISCGLIRTLRLRNFEMRQQLYQHANVDVLTGLPNRRSFMRAWERKLKLGAPGQSLYFMMLDVDDFKKINDAFGHDVGDLALIQIAQVLQAVDPTLEVARLGGEEFAVVGQLDAQSAEAVAGQLVREVNLRQVEGRRLSVSVGIAQQGHQEPFTEVMRRADEALYMAKRAGKNQFRHAPDLQAPEVGAESVAWQESLA
jgi:diguanylate cyclase (GGDEF)-like protein